MSGKGPVSATVGVALSVGMAKCSSEPFYITFAARAQLLGRGRRLG